ncbi:starch synthase 1, chloroplastic/amyloplastic-like [Macadamia integrifolia]|uniref:starch synthase 1, chloroplastic/amyloplastic-like n=1 Tax=Macadamia integrifolia TaxID=60698 RepID=UPI001C4E87DD|nr:starch synthase 1, chloroplastic/amyloplastic-like [Macadamia integrifolia]
MEALQINRIVICKFPLTLSENPQNSGLVKQKCFASWRIRRGGASLLLRRSVADKNKVQFRSLRDKFTAGARRKDEDGSRIGLQLFPEFGEEEVVESDLGIVSDKGEETKGIDEEEKPPTKVTYNIVFVTSEAAPYSKTGGLGDVCGSLPLALAARGHSVMVVSPRYLRGGPSDKIFGGAFDVNCRIKISCFGGLQEVAFFHEYRAGVDWVFVDHPSYHRPGNPYGDSQGAFGDNQFRFTLLCHAACEAPLVIPLRGSTYGEKCLFLANDWHGGLVPVLLAAKYRPHGVYKDARSILVLHNLAHQGVEPASTYMNFGLPPEWYGALEWVFPTWARTHALDTGEAVNILKGAIVTADRILTVSQGYSWEITTAEGGQGLNELLSSRKSILNGIVNGINVDEWNPASDEHIPFHYSVDDLSGKVQCKTALQEELGLAVRPDCPVIGFIGRLDYQKGVDLILSAIPELMQDDIQFIMLGSGDLWFENWMRALESTYTDKFRGWVGFSVPVSHRITAGCDILLMPSRFEPCGLNQLYAMRYGTVPVVHGTGGLKDTVENFNPYAEEGSGQGTGWAFSPLSKESMLAGLRLATGTYREHNSSWEGLMKRGMEKDYTWDKAATQYEQVIEWAFYDPPYVQ